MEDVHEGQWICHLADALACEIIKEMAEIPLKRMDTRVHDRMLDVVHGNIDGEYPMKLLFRAEPRLFGRIAENMIGEQPEDEEETREYAREFFNVLCGRFVSEPPSDHPVGWPIPSCRIRGVSYGL